MSAHEMRRVTLNLIPQAACALDDLIRIRKFSQTDTVNRALQVYALVEKEMATGKQLCFRDLVTGQVEVVHIV